MTNNLEFILKLKDLLSPAMQNAANLTEGEAAKISSSVRRIGVSAESATGGVNVLKTGMKGLLEIAAPFIGVFAGFEFLKGSAEKFNEQEQAVAQLNASLQSTKGAAGLSSQALQEQAKALQETTLYGDEATIKMQALLLTFTNIKGKIYQEAVPAIQDMATKMGYDLKDTAVQVGKALNDPIKGITALRRVGVAFSDSQTAVIKNLVDTGQTAQAQALILHELQNEFGGSAAAAAKAGTGPFKQLADRFGDVREKIGGIIERLGMVLMPMLNGFVNLVDSAVEAMKTAYHWMQQHKEIMGALALVIGSVVTVLAVYEGILGIISIATGAWTVASAILNATLWANPVTWIIAGVIALVAIIGYLVYAFDGWGKTWKNLMDYSKYSWAAFKDNFQIIWLNVQDAFMSGIELMEKGWYKLKALWDKDGAAAGLATINSQQNARAEAIAKANGLLLSDVKAAEAANKWEVHSNGKTLGGIVGDLKKKLGISTGGVNPATANGGFAAGGNGSGLAGDIGDGKSKADSINQGGQRSIVVNIQKQIEKLEVHVMDAKEGANEIESAVRDALKRVLYSLNGVAS
ncbi:MAG: phage tail length tape measure family protein [Bacteroidota bacterium]|nr:phage tail length tape measure family protein [Bacteroidota bacterium]